MKKINCTALLLLIWLSGCADGNRLPEPFYGTYNASNGYGYEQLILRPNGRYEQQSGGCVGIYSKGRGRYNYDPATNQVLIEVQPQLMGKPYGAPEAHRYFLIAWGRRHYAISENERTMFMCFVASSTDPYKHNRSLFLQNSHDTGKSLANNARLPQQWAPEYARLLAALPGPGEKGPSLLVSKEWQQFQQLITHWGP